MLLDVKPTEAMAKQAMSRKYNIIGSGAYREVYRADDSEWCFKVDLRKSLFGGNQSEWETYLQVYNAPWLNDGLRIPEMHMLSNGILAVRYIEGTHPDKRIRCVPETHRYNCIGEDCWAYRVTNYVTINDIHPANLIMTADKILYIIDLGHGIY